MCSLTQMSGSPTSCCTHSARPACEDERYVKKNKKKKLELLTPFLCRAFSPNVQFPLLVFALR